MSSFVQRARLEETCAILALPPPPQPGIIARIGLPVFERLENLLKRSEEIDEIFGSPESGYSLEQLNKLAKERADLQPVVTAYQQLQAANAELADARMLASDDDPDVAEMAREEAARFAAETERLESELRAALVPTDPHDSKNAILEIRGGTGGDEAALFAGDLLRMYQRYAQRHGLQVEIISASGTEGGGFKEVVCSVAGQGAYRLLKHESGVHRVQRVPTTEAQGRIHTSTATVAVLPEADEVDVSIRPEDLRIDIFHSGGPGGQNVNKVATAVRVVHAPTGIVVVSQGERSQLRNKNEALAVLRSRLYEQQLQEQQAHASATRRSQVGSGERSEKVRTYNFPQDRLTDHRIGMSIHGLQEVMNGAGQFDALVQALLQDEQTRLLEESGEDSAA